MNLSLVNRALSGSITGAEFNWFPLRAACPCLSLHLSLRLLRRFYLIPLNLSAGRIYPQNAGTGRFLEAPANRSRPDEIINLHETGCKKTEVSFARRPSEVKRGLGHLVATRLP